MFDTHCHLNFSAFKKNLQEVIDSAHTAGISHIVIPSTDITSSKKSIEIASAHENIYAAVGIHPHHVFELKINSAKSQTETDLKSIEELLAHDKVVAVGEVGVDRYLYTQTKYKEYSIDEEFIALQKQILASQVQMAISSGKSLILHNRIAKNDLFEVLENNWDTQLEYRSVLHCCEPDKDLLSFAKEHNMFMGVDGDVTFITEKQEFIKRLGPEEFLSRYVLETDAPFLLPEPLRAQKKYPNKPQNIAVIAEFIAKLLNVDVEIVQKRTTENARILFNII